MEALVGGSSGVYGGAGKAGRHGQGQARGGKGGGAKGSKGKGAGKVQRRQGAAGECLDMCISFLTTYQRRLSD